MIAANLLDGGTDVVVKSNHRPGMDLITWNEVDYEEELQNDASLVIGNNEMQNADTFRIEPDDSEFTPHMPVDFTPRYEGLTTRLDIYDYLTDSVGHLDGGAVEMKPMARQNTLSRPDTGASDEQTQDEVRSFLPDPTVLYHLDPANTSNSTDLKQPYVVHWNNLHGSGYRPAVEDNFFFTPFDSTDNDNYNVYADDGTLLSQSAIDVTDSQHYHFHLRPRLWKCQTLVLARYMWVTGFEYAYNDETFIVQSHFRPPVYPYRHNVLVSRESTPIDDFWGTPVSYDRGIDYFFSSSRVAAQLRDEILKQQWQTFCAAYILIQVFPATLYIYTEVPRVGEISFGMTKRDLGLNAESVWLKQTGSMASEYPNDSVGVFYSDFF